MKDERDIFDEIDEQEEYEFPSISFSISESIFDFSRLNPSATVVGVRTCFARSEAKFSDSVELNLKMIVD